QPPRLVQLQPPVLLPPAVVRLLGDRGLLAGLRGALPIRDGHFDLPQERHDLLGLCPRLRHDQPPSPGVESLIPPGTKKAGHVILDNEHAHTPEYIGAAASPHLTRMSGTLQWHLRRHPS